VQGLNWLGDPPAVLARTNLSISLFERYLKPLGEHNVRSSFAKIYGNFVPRLESHVICMTVLVSLVVTSFTYVSFANEMPVATLSIVSGHSSAVNSVAFSPDAKYVVSGSDDGTTILWEVATGAEVYRSEKQDYAVTTVRFKSETEIVYITTNSELHYVDILHHWSVVKTRITEVTAGSVICLNNDCTQLLLDSTEGALNLVSIDKNTVSSRLGKIKGFLRAASISSSLTYVVSAASDGTLTLWPLGSASGRQKLQGDAGVVRSIAVSPDGRYVLSGGDDATVYLWDAGSLKQLKEFAGHNRSVYAVKFSIDGTEGFSAGWDKRIRRWNLKTGKEVSEFVGHAGAVLTLDVSRDTQLLVSGGVDGTVRLWSLANGREVRCFGCIAENTVATALFDNGQRMVAAFANSGMQGGLLSVWDTNAWKELWRSKPATARITSLAALEEGTDIVTGHADGEITIWDGRTGQIIYRKALGRWPIQALSLVKKRQDIFVAASGSEIVLGDLGSDDLKYFGGINNSPVWGGINVAVWTVYTIR
jgi:WD40 repeat protein